MSNIPKCFLKLSKSVEKQQPVEKQPSVERQPVEKQLVEKKEPAIKMIKQPDPEFDYDEPDFEDEFGDEFVDEEISQNEAFVREQKKLGLMCTCGLPTILREVKKDGPNKGKTFYTCSNNYAEKCNCFMWKDESDRKMGKKMEIKKAQAPAPEPTPSPEPAPAPSQTLVKQEEVEEDDFKHQQKIGLICYCKLPSVLREVWKDE